MKRRENTFNKKKLGFEKTGLKLNIGKKKELRSWHLVPSLQGKQGGEVEAGTAFLFSGSKITEDGDCSHKIRRRLPLGRKATTNLDNMLQSKDITLLTKVHLSRLWPFW